MTIDIDDIIPATDRDREAKAEKTEAELKRQIERNRQDEAVGVAIERWHK